MHDMLRIMDVASTLRRERETAEAQLDLATQQQRLRERLLATAAAAGEAVTAAEVDAAIEQYFAEQHRYQDPPGGWKNFVAHCYVQRIGCLFLLGFVGLLIGGIFAVASPWTTAPPERRGPAPVVTPAPRPAPVPPPSPAPRPTPAPGSGPGLAPAVPPPPAPIAPPAEDLASVWAGFTAEAAAAAALAADDVAKASVEMVAKMGRVHHAAANLERLRASRSELREVAQRLGEEYTVTIVDRPGQKSGFERLYDGRVSGYYLVVEALDRAGTALRRSIVNTETKSRHDVTQWGEEVPLEVWERVVADKQQDGVIDQAVFAQKRRGIMSAEIVLEGSRGKPLPQGRRVTSW
jgi:hypothetical protein